ncbi:MAG: aspartate aminotransferase family protein [Gammaproteobacteria bacterium]|nr:aspartate aminotransferase family protein [Gammaproteobacteria bacterium]
MSIYTMQVKNITTSETLIDNEDLQFRDLVNHIWLDFQQMGSFIADPLVVTGGEGMRVRTDDGREFIDAIGGAIVSTLGYGNKSVRTAMHAAIDRQDFWPVLHATTPSALLIAKRLAELLPGNLECAFLLTGGSEATETAMKMARQYHRLNGQPTRYKVLSRYWSYHGATFNALAASGVGDRRKFEPLPGGFIHVNPPYCYRCPWGKKPESCNIECATAFKDVIRYEGEDTISAIIVDPVMAAAGVLVPPKNYYRILRELCDQHGILLIFDEVLTGFGRLGTLFACDYYDVVPDLICLGKGITSGYAPFAAVVAGAHITEKFIGDDARTFLHGHTYGGHPLGCETALAVIDELLSRDLIAQAATNGEYLRGRLLEIAKRHPEIGDIRGIGMIWGIEFVQDKKTRKHFPSKKARAIEIRQQAHKLGLLTRGSAHVIIIAPALTASFDELDEIIDILDQAITVSASH